MTDASTHATGAERSAGDPVKRVRGSIVQTGLEHFCADRSGQCGGACFARRLRSGAVWFGSVRGLPVIIRTEISVCTAVYYVI